MHYRIVCVYISFKIFFKTEPYGMRVDSLLPLYGNDQYEGFAVDIIKELAAIRGFNYTFLVREDMKNGEQDAKTGKWNGIIGDLIDGVSNNRSKVIKKKM